MKHLTGKAFGICGLALLWLVPAEASAGVGARAGVQVRNGNFGVVGVHLNAPVFPLVHMRPTFEIAKRSGETIYNPSMDVYLNANPIGIGPGIYVGAGVGWHATRFDVGNGSNTDHRASVNVFGGIQSRVAPFTSLLVEVKGVFVERSRTARLLIGLSISK